MTRTEVLANFQVIKDQIEHFGEVFFDESDIPMIDVVIESLDGVHGEWIPCSERLPQENGRYFVTRGLNACGSLWNRVYIVNYSDLMGLKKEKIWWDGNVGKSDFRTYEDVLAWQPLTEPWSGAKMDL